MKFYFLSGVVLQNVVDCFFAFAHTIYNRPTKCSRSAFGVEVASLMEGRPWGGNYFAFIEIFAHINNDDHIGGRPVRPNVTLNIVGIRNMWTMRRGRGFQLNGSLCRFYV